MRHHQPHRCTALALLVALLGQVDPAHAAPARKRGAPAAPAPDTAGAARELQAADEAIKAGQYADAMTACNRAVALDPGFAPALLRRSGLRERLVGADATWAALRAAAPAPHFAAVAEQLFYAAADAELSLQLLGEAATNRPQVEARIADLRLRQRRAEELAAPFATAPPATGPAAPAAPPATGPAAPVVGPAATPASEPATSVVGPTTPSASAPSALRPATSVVGPATPPASAPSAIRAASPVDPAAPVSLAPAPVGASPPVALDPTTPPPDDGPPLAIAWPEEAPLDDAAPPPVAEPPIAAGPHPVLDPAPRCPPPAKVHAGLRIGGALLTSVGVALGAVAATGLVLGGRAESEYESALDVDARDRADARGKAMNGLAIAGFVGAAAMIGTGAALLGIDANRRRTPRLAASLSPRMWGLVLHANF